MSRIFLLGLVLSGFLLGNGLCLAAQDQTAPASAPQVQTWHYVEEGVASWYGPKFHGRQTSNGEIYDSRLLTAAHRTLPFNTLVRVTNLANGRSLVVRINDRGPFVSGRNIDLSQAAAEKLGYIGVGTTHVRLEAELVKSAQANSSQSHVIQVASFSNSNNANNLARVLQQRGLPVRLELSPNGLTYRVNLSPVAAGNLSATLDTLKSLGFSNVAVH